MRTSQHIVNLLKSEKALVITDQAVCSITTFITTILLARVLGVASFGIYSSIVLLSYLGLAMSSALLVSPFQVLQASVTNKRTYSVALLMLQFMFVFVAGILLYILSRSGLHVLASFVPYTHWIILMFSGFLLQDFFRRTLLGSGKALQALIVDLSGNIPQLLLLLAFAWKDALDLSISFKLIAVTFIPCVVTGVFFMEIQKVSWSEMKQYSRLHFHHGKWLLLTAFTQWWANHMLVVASGLYLGVESLGALRLVQSLFGVLNVMLQVYENYFLPKAAQLYIQSSEALKRYLLVITGKSLLLMLPLAAILFLFARPVLILAAGDTYGEYGFVMQGMVLLYLFIFLGYPLRIAIRVMNLNRDFFIAYLFPLVFSLLLSAVLISRWGIAGVIAGLIVNQLLVLIYWHLVLVRKQFHLIKFFGA
jgi:O-antigen/teichoic acid export membrane protein